jgi:hypothetical protein
VTRLIHARSNKDDEELVEGEHMVVAIALSLLQFESAPRDSPLFGKMFTFHEQPQLLTVPNIPDHATSEVPEGGLAKRVEWVRSMEWGGSTNFNPVIDLMLVLHPAMKVSVFYDMQFNEARDIWQRLGRLHTSH